MLFRLALAMQEPDIDALANRVTLRTLGAWWGFWLLEPWGNEWRMTAKLAAHVRGAMGTQDDTDYEDRFVPGCRPREQTREEAQLELMKIPVFASQILANKR